MSSNIIWKMILRELFSVLAERLSCQCYAARSFRLRKIAGFKIILDFTHIVGASQSEKQIYTLRRKQDRDPIWGISLSSGFHDETGVKNYYI